MKSLILAITLLLSVHVSQAQVQFASGSAKPLNPEAATQNLGAQKASPRAKYRLVKCRDGSRHTAPACRRRHGGVRW